METVTDRIFRMGHGLCAAEMFSLFGRRWLYLFLALIVLGIIAGFFISPVWFMVTLILVFTVVPMAVLFLYYYYGLNTECYMNVSPHSLGLSEDGVKVSLYEALPDDEEEAGPPAMTRAFTIGCDRLGSMRLGHDSVSFLIPGKGFLWIPRSAFLSDEKFAGFIESINRIKKI